MHLGRILGFLVVAVSTVLAQQKNGDNALKTPAPGQAIPAGQNLEITWTPTTKGTVSIFLVKGTAGNLQQVLEIAPGQVNNGIFRWSPDKNLQGLQTMPAGEGYAIKIVDDATKNFNEGGVFKLDSPNSTFVTTPAAGASSPPATGAPTSAATPATPAAPSTPASATSAASTPASTPSSASSVATPPPSTLSTATAPPTSTASTASASEPPSSTTDAASSTSAAASSTSSDSAANATSSSSASATATAVPGGKKLPTGAIIGIAAGVIVVVVGAIVGVIFFMRRKKVDRESKMFGGAVDPNYLRNSGYKPQTSYDSEFAMMERQRPYGEFRETGPYSQQQQNENIGMARF